MSPEPNSAKAPPSHHKEDDVSTKTQLLDAAEDLFEQSGIRGTSLRAITERAKANIASVNYHFGSKADLVRAVIARRIDPLNEERIRLLDALEEQDDYDLEDVLTALIGPAIQHPERYPGLRLLARLHVEPNIEFSELVQQPFIEVQRRFFVAIRRTAPHVTDLSLHWRLSFAVAAMAATIANLDRLHQIKVPKELLAEGLPDFGSIDTDPRTITQQLVRFVAGGIQADNVENIESVERTTAKSRSKK